MLSKIEVHGSKREKVRRGCHKENKRKNEKRGLRSDVSVRMRGDGA